MHKKTNEQELTKNVRVEVTQKSNQKSSNATYVSSEFDAISQYINQIKNLDKQIQQISA